MPDSRPAWVRHSSCSQKPLHLPDPALSPPPIKNSVAGTLACLPWVMSLTPALNLGVPCKQGPQLFQQMQGPQATWDGYSADMKGIVNEYTGDSLYSFPGLPPRTCWWTRPSKKSPSVLLTATWIRLSPTSAVMGPPVAGSATVSWHSRIQ